MRFIFKKLFAIYFFAALLSLSSLRAADETSAKKSPFFETKGFVSAVLNQSFLSNWAKGGENSVSILSSLYYSAKMNRGSFSWENLADLKFGLINGEEYGTRVNQDQINLSSKLGFKALDEFFYTALLDFKSQFAFGYDYPNDSIPVSKFFAPAYLIASLGMDYKPSDHFSLYFSPMTGKFIFVADKDIANVGSYTGEPAKYDSSGALIKRGSRYRGDFGVYIRATLNKEIYKNVSAISKLELFNNYTDKIIENRKNIDVDWETTLIFKFNSLLSVNFYFRTIYDHDIKIPIYKTIDGQKTQVGAGPRLQIKESIGVGVTYNL